MVGRVFSFLGIWFVLCTFLWAQEIPPISTHRPTQGIHAGILEAKAVQLETGFQPVLLGRSRLQGEAVAQLRVGLGREWETFATGGLFLPSWTAFPLSIAAKKRLLSSKSITFSAASWAYLPVEGHPLGGQLWLLSDWSLSKQGTLSLNGVGGYFATGKQVFLTAFYTQTIGQRWATWAELFAYVPEAPPSPRNRYGFGTGIQYLWGAHRQAAIDVAFNYSDAGPFQVLLGVSAKRNKRPSRTP